MATFVFVHGGGQGGWAFSPLGKILRGQGHHVLAPSLTGMGDREHLRSPEVGLDTHITEIAQLLFHEDLSEVILAGHSYGGMVITGVADRVAERIAHLVYLDAAIPEDGEALVDVVPAAAASKANNKIIDGCECCLLPEGGPAMHALDGSPYADWAAQRFSPQPWKTFTDTLQLSRPDAVTAIPRSIINCTGPLGRRPQEIKSRWLTGQNVWELDTGHTLTLTETQKVAELLMEVAGQV